MLFKDENIMDANPNNCMDAVFRVSGKDATTFAIRLGLWPSMADSGRERRLSVLFIWIVEYFAIVIYTTRQTQKAWFHFNLLVLYKSILFDSLFRLP